MIVDTTFSCIIPAYNSFDSRRVRLTVDSVLAQDGRGTEAVVVECNKTPELEDLGHLQGVKYVFVPAETSFNTGTIRNLGVLASTRPFLYLSDGDIVLQKSGFLSDAGEALLRDSELVLRRPPMRRLVIDSFEAFWGHRQRSSLRSAMDLLDTSSRYAATLGTPAPSFKLVSRPDGKPYEAWTTTPELYALYKSCPSLKTSIPVIFCGTRHWGGVALRREHFDVVGGYAPTFEGWGNEDTDLQWKLGECFRMEVFPDEPRYEVLHLDHERPYFKPENWMRNRSLASARTELGLAAVVERDRIAFSRLRERQHG